MLLLSALTTAKTFATALQQIGVPYTIVDGKGFYERQEIIDLLNLLIFLEDSSPQSGIGWRTASTLFCH